MIKALLLATAIFVLPYSNDPKAGETLNKEKYAECLLNIPIDYKDVEQNFEESKKYADVEIVLVRATGKGKIKSIERGFIMNWEKNGKKGVFFEPKESVNSGHGIAKFPIFNDKGTYCYKAECFDSKE